MLSPVFSIFTRRVDHLRFSSGVQYPNDEGVLFSNLVTHHTFFSANAGGSHYGQYSLASYPTTYVLPWTVGPKQIRIEEWSNVISATGRVRNWMTTRQTRFDCDDKYQYYVKEKAETSNPF
jgi:hypothetical protein